MRLTSTPMMRAKALGRRPVPWRDTWSQQMLVLVQNGPKADRRELTWDRRELDTDRQRLDADRRELGTDRREFDADRRAFTMDGGEPSTDRGESTADRGELARTHRGGSEVHR